MKRIEWIDIAKGLGIILVVLGHCKSESSCIHQFIYMFHMPLFFILSGFCSHRNADSSWGKYVWHKAQRLLIPFLVFLLIPAIYYGIMDGQWSYIYSWFFGEIVWANPPIWFLLVLWCISVLFDIKYFQTIWIWLLSTIACFIISQYIHIPLYVDTISVCGLFYWVGNYLRRINIQEQISRISKFSMRIGGGGLLMMLFLEVLCNNVSSINYRAFEFGKLGLISIISFGICGSVLVCLIAYLISTHDKIVFKKWIILLGEGTMPIICLHWFVRDAIYMIGIHNPFLVTGIILLFMTGVLCLVKSFKLLGLLFGQNGYSFARRKYKNMF